MKDGRELSIITSFPFISLWAICSFPTLKFLGNATTLFFRDKGSRNIQSALGKFFFVYITLN